MSILAGHLEKGITNMRNQYWAAMLLASLLYTSTQHRTHASAEQTEQLVRNTMSLDANRRRGESLFRSECSGCHGRKALGDAERLIPALAGQRRAYLIKQMADFAELERNAPQMHMVMRRAKIASPKAWADLALYLNSLPIPGKSQIGNSSFLDLGEASYKQWCAGCHADDGRGDDDGFVPSLRNQHYRYLLTEMEAMGVGHRTLEPELMRLLGSLTGDELLGIADYVSRLRGPIVDRARLRDDGSLSD
jgi:cytochrome c553